MAASVEKRGARLTAVLLVLLASLLYVPGYALSKQLVLVYGCSALQLTFLRCSLVLACGIGLIAAPVSRLSWRRIGFPASAFEQRAAALVGPNVLSIMSYSLTSITGASALAFSTPLMLTLMGALLLAESVSLFHWCGC
ncbi:hypothetical protein FJU30_10015 [Affinibrenneria salicis]|uniref:EamA domain-containing protein n=1 Tax=Affinibrenneria salicis TaxID=2590031 RepID=A0A5J5G1J9_9GAMM|nr:hypothetical protein [Affinibrenneria salicis]KAA9000555.1 hypothetical protein FJU30_10015 [Affinibrenneria salicis]